MANLEKEVAQDLKKLPAFLKSLALHPMKMVKTRAEWGWRETIVLVSASSFVMGVLRLVALVFSRSVRPDVVITSLVSGPFLVLFLSSGVAGIFFLLFEWTHTEENRGAQGESPDYLECFRMASVALLSADLVQGVLELLGHGLGNSVFLVLIIEVCVLAWGLYLFYIGAERRLKLKRSSMLAGLGALALLGYMILIVPAYNSVDLRMTPGDWASRGRPPSLLGAVAGVGGKKSSTGPDGGEPLLPGGVRPDIVKYIEEHFGTPAKLKRAALQFARVLQSVLSYPDDSDGIEEKFQQSTACLRAITDLGTRSTVKTELEHRTFNSYARAKAYIEYSQSRSGKISVIRQDSEDECE